MEQCEIHPRRAANVLSRVSFFYNIEIFLKGYRKSLESDDLYRVLDSCRSKQAGDALEAQWKENRSSIRNALWRCYGKSFLILGLLQLVVKTTTTAWLPSATSKLVSYFSPGQEAVTEEDAIYHASVVIGLTIFNVFFYYNCQLALTKLGIRVRTAVCSLLYRKALCLSPEALSGVTVGKIVTIMTKDVDVFFTFVYYGNDVWIPLVQTGTICYLIYSKIGVAAFAGVAFYLVILPLQIIISRIAFPLRLKSSKKTDERLELLQEVLTAVKIIKMHTWEKFFQQKINTARRNELQILHKLFFTRIWIIIIASLGSKAAFFIFLMTYIYLGNSESNLTAEVVFYILSCCSDLEYSLSILIPLGLSFTAEMCATTRRIDEVLSEPELPAKRKELSGNPKIVFSGTSVRLKNKTILEKIHLRLEEGLYVMVGHVGSGKTTLLKTILQEFGDDDLNISGSISYASQEPWLFPSTIRNNILFGEEFNEQRYQEVLRVCDLEYDLQLLPHGDATIISRLNLSKGQQTRINLARAVYKQSDIYLLDDSLASLDAHVSHHIFKECILRFLKNKLCVFVSNNSAHAVKADGIIEVNHGMVKVNKTMVKKVEEEVVTENQKCGQVEKSPQVYHEVKKSGKVSLKDYRKYVANGGGMIMFGVVILLFVTTQAAFNFSDKLLSQWITLRENVSTSANVSLEVLAETSSTLNLCTITLLSSIFLTLLKCLVFFYFTKTASINLHKHMTKNVLNSSMVFFDSNFVGNILNRFSKDCQTVDEHLPFMLIECLTMVFMAVGGIILLTTVNIVFLLESLVVFVFVYFLKRFCQPAGRNLQRLNSATRSPMVGHLNSSLEGLTTIRANNAQKRVIEEFDSYQDAFTSASYMLSDCQLALGFGLELFTSIFTTVVIVQLLVTESDPSVGDVGLAITQAFMITEIISTGVKNVAECENLMTSVERILEYTELEEETSEQVVPAWPIDGKLEFEDVSLWYNNAKTSLEQVSFKLAPKEKLGVVGRTGAGKSSIISTLLRLYHIQGKIQLDDVDTSKLSLKFLRTNISVIPQDPFLFTGTIRENLDPFKEYRDEQIWKVLEKLHLKAFVEELTMKIDKGSSFSAGQKQLLCLARAVLCNNKIVVLDEVTANVDKATEILMQEVVASQFEYSTVIIIAHKLDSILRCDKVLAVNDGKVVEFGEPVRLLEDKTSFLYSLVK